MNKLMTKKIFGGAALFGMLLTASGALAAGEITVSNFNIAHIDNTATVSSNTGNNTANGSYGGNGGNGGVATALGGWGTKVANGGEGGNGGAGGAGGVISTGNALASSFIMNQANTVETDIDVTACGCKTVSETHNMGNTMSHEKDWGFWGGSEDHSASAWNNWSHIETPVAQGDIEVKNANVAHLSNDARVGANSGGNVATGNKGGNAGNGGAAMAANSGLFWWLGSGASTANGGDAGNGGTGGDGGVVLTGSAGAGSEIVNVTNEVVTRITKN